MVDARGPGPPEPAGAQGYQKFLGLELRLGGPRLCPPASWTPPLPQPTASASSTCSVRPDRVLVEDTYYSDSPGSIARPFGSGYSPTPSERGLAVPRSFARRQASCPSPGRARRRAPDGAPARRLRRRLLPSRPRATRCPWPCGWPSIVASRPPEQAVGVGVRRPSRASTSGRPASAGCSTGCSSAPTRPPALARARALLPPARGHDPPLLRARADPGRPGPPAPRASAPRALLSPPGRACRPHDDKAESHRAAVIGSGFGGLAAAIRLQAAGVETVLFEERDRPGGRAYVYEDEGFTFDAGPTVITAPALPRGAVHAGRPDDGRLRRAAARRRRSTGCSGPTATPSTTRATPRPWRSRSGARNPGDVAGYRASWTTPRRSS